MEEDENIVPLSALGLDDEDLIEVRHTTCPEGGAEVLYELTETGNALLEEAAARAGIMPEDYLKRLTFQEITPCVDQTQAREFKGYLLGRICPVFVRDPGEDCRIRPRLWGRLTFPLVAWYCGVALNDCPMVIPSNA